VELYFSSLRPVKGLVDSKIVSSWRDENENDLEIYLLGVEANRNEDECMYVVRF
jgi:hypothetical protein